MSPRLPTLIPAALLLFAGPAACDDGGAGAEAGTPDAGGPDVVSADTGEQDAKKPPPDTGPDNRPPELERIGDRVAASEEPLVIVVEAADPDEDSLAYSVYGALPEEARFVKAERRFEWTPAPEDVGDAVFLTFVVSDGEAFDRETVRIEVVADKGANPPEILPVGDQAVVAGEPFEMALKATDPDGDTVTWGHDGPLPQGATLESATGLFRWTPPQSRVGSTVRVTFTASDGTATTEADVSFVVKADDGGEGPSPPELAPPAAQDVGVGEALEVILEATDPDGDDVTFGLHGGAPPESTLEGAVFRWTPDAGDAGQSWSVTFSATDGTFTSFATLDLTVVKPQTGPGCTDDPGEPNEGVDAATDLAPGTLEASICDTDLVPVDVDFYAVDVDGGQAVDLTLSFDPSQGDLDLFLVDAEESILASSETASAEESLTWNAEASQTVYAVVAGFGQETFHTGYTLELSLEVPETCQDDDFEPNDDFSGAASLPDSGTPLALCPGDTDVWHTWLYCGETMTATLDTGGTGDLDLSLWDEDGQGDTPLARSATPDEVETLVLDAAPAEGPYWLRVVGYPPGQGSGTYTLDVTYDGECEDDALVGNGALVDAAPLEGVDGVLEDLVVCCGADWFAVEAGAGADLLAAVTPSGDGSVGVTAYAPDGVTALDVASPEESGGTVGFVTEEAGTHYLRVEGAVHTGYSLEWLVDGGGEEPAECATASCPQFEVCDAEAGECVSDLCPDGTGCPTGHACHDGYCTDPCEADADCRTSLDYACKAFADGRHCALAGSGEPGGACISHENCAGAAVCTFQGSEGYCAIRDCAAPGFVCPDGTACTEHPDGGTLCAVMCGGSGDCREDDGYVCQEGVCLPQ
ncbi:MAG: putative Ig domain-containing protein [Myxococcota bacterium]